MGRDKVKPAGLKASGIEQTAPSESKYPPFLTVVERGVGLSVRAKPGCRQSGVAIEGEELVISITAPPRDGEANSALLEFLSEVLGVRRTAVTHASGSKSRCKMFKVAGLTPDEVLHKLKAAEAAGS